MRPQSIKQRAILAEMLAYYVAEARERKDAGNARMMRKDVATGLRLWEHAPYLLAGWQSQSESISTLRAVDQLVSDGLLEYGWPWRNPRGKPSKTIVLTVTGYHAAIADAKTRTRVSVELPAGLPHAVNPAWERYGLPWYHVGFDVYRPYWNY
jgi:hypothetical protein